MMRENPAFGSINDITDQISQAEVGSHNILIYSSIDTFRKLYSNYIKRQLEQSNEVVIILPYYETAAKTREVLFSEGIVDTAITIEGDEMNNDSNNRRNNNEKEGSITIDDSLKVYSSSGPDGISNNNSNVFGWNLIQDLVNRVKKNSGKKSVTVIADLGSFFHHHLGDTQRLVDYELSLPPSRFDDGLKLKGLCVYHKEDFEKRFTQEQKQKLLQHHRQAFIVEDR